MGTIIDGGYKYEPDRVKEDLSTVNLVEDFYELLQAMLDDELSKI